MGGEYRRSQDREVLTPEQNWSWNAHMSSSVRGLGLPGGVPAPVKHLLGAPRKLVGLGLLQSP